MNTVNVIITATLIVLAVILNQVFKDKESDNKKSFFEKALVESGLDTK